MYFKLTETQYKKKRSEFRKTYVGKVSYVGMVVWTILFFVMTFFNVIAFDFSADESFNMFDLYVRLFSLSFWIVCTILTCTCTAHYMQEFKEFVNHGNKGE